MDDFTRRKDGFLMWINDYIARCGMITPIPIDFIDALDTVKAWAETANLHEWPEIEAWRARMEAA